MSVATLTTFCIYIAAMLLIGSIPWRARLRHAAVYALLTLAILSPYLLFVQANGGVGAYCESTPYKKLAKADPWAARLYHGVNVVERDDRIEYLLMSNERLQEGDVSAYPADAPRFDAQRQLYRDLALQEKLYVPGITETEKYHVEGYETKDPQGRLWHNTRGGMIPEW